MEAMEMIKKKLKSAKFIGTVVAVVVALLIVFFATMQVGEYMWERVEPKPEPLPLEDAQFQFIAELATVDSYYHNVTKVFEEDHDGFWPFYADLNFWIDSEYTVTYGLNAELVTFKLKGDTVTITIPKAKVLKLKNSAKENNTYLAKDSADVGEAELILAYEEIEQEIYKDAKENTLLLDKAEQQAKLLLTNYVNKIGNSNGTTYKIKWVTVDENGNSIK